MSKAAELAALIGSQTALSNKNMIINGAFQCWQRSTSVSSQTGSGYQTTDRWRTNASGGTYNQSRQTVPLGDSVVGDFKYFLRHEVTTGDNFTGIQQRIEDVQSVPEGTLTLSFYAKGTNPNAGSITIGTNQYFGTGGSPSSNVEVTSAATFTVTSSWQRFNFQLTVASISGKTLGTNDDSYFQIQFTQDGNDTSTDAWTLDITGVQLEVGQTATPFEHEGYETTIQKCYRYYYKTDLDLGTNSPYLIGSYAFAVSTTLVWCITDYPVTMRIRPTALEQSGTATDYGVLRCGRSTAVTCSTVPIYTNGTSNRRAVSQFAASGFTNGVTGFPMNNNTNGTLAWSVEL